jgi:ADP-ribose pyrophosphatase YjhB (NUDIX family)
MEGNLKKFCPYCGSILTNKHIEGRVRSVCSSCHKIAYENPIPSVAIVARNSDGDILMVKRSVEPAKGFWSLAGGFIEVGETTEEAVLREMKEETGLTGDIGKVIDVCTSLNGYWGDVVIIGYEVLNLRGKIVPGDDASEVKFFPLNNCPSPVFRSHKRILEKYLVRFPKNPSIRHNNEIF